MLTGIQSLHGWMSAQTRITPKLISKKKAKKDSDEEVKIANDLNEGIEADSAPTQATSRSPTLLGLSSLFMSR